MNSEFKLGNKTYNLSSNDSYEENIIFPHDKSNHIILCLFLNFCSQPFEARKDPSLE
jgi:hypothetical protein